LAIFAWCPAAFGDVLFLKNGDQITGTIKRIWDQEITIEPEYADEFQVDLPMVERIESDRDFEIEADMAQQLENARAMQRDGKIPTLEAVQAGLTVDTD
jgi:hypothetical protein